MVIGRAENGSDDHQIIVMKWAKEQCKMIVIIAGSVALGNVYGYPALYRIGVVWAVLFVI